MLGQPRRAKDAVAFAAKIFGREPPLVPRGPKPDELADGFQVRRLSEEGLRFFVRHRSAEPGGHRVNEHQVAQVQNGILVVHKAEGRLGQRAVIVHLDAARPERAEVQPDGGGAGAAVETEHDGPGGRVGPAQPRVSHVKNGRARSAVGFEQRQHAGFSRVIDALAGDGDGVGGEHRFVGGIGDRRGGGLFGGPVRSGGRGVGSRANRRMESDDGRGQQDQRGFHHIGVSHHAPNRRGGASLIHKTPRRALNLTLNRRRETAF